MTYGGVRDGDTTGKMQSTGKKEVRNHVKCECVEVYGTLESRGNTRMAKQNGLEEWRRNQGRDRLRVKKRTPGRLRGRR